MISIDSVRDKIDVLIAKATALKTILGPTGPTGHEVDLEMRSSHTWYGIAEALKEDVDNSINTIVNTTKKVESIYS